MNTPSSDFTKTSKLPESYLLKSTFCDFVSCVMREAGFTAFFPPETCCSKSIKLLDRSSSGEGLLGGDKFQVSSFMFLNPTTTSSTIGPIARPANSRLLQGGVVKPLIEVGSSNQAYEPVRAFTLILRPARPHFGVLQNIPK